MDELTSKYIEKMLEIMLSESDDPLDTISNITRILACLLPSVALRTGVKSNENYDVTQRMAYIGNKAVVTAIQSLEENGKSQSLKDVDELLKNFRG